MTRAAPFWGGVAATSTSGALAGGACGYAGPVTTGGAMRATTGTREDEAAVVLVVPPVLHPVQPSLGAFVLAPAVTRAGVPARVIEANVAFAGRVGFDFCAALAGSLPWKLLGEAVFWAAAFPERADEHSRILTVVNG